jgi:site-specific DNA-methyltransferase (adenine-specific)
MKNTSTAYIFSSWNNLEHLESAVQDANLHTLNHVLWRYQFGVFTRKKFVTSHYHILVVVKDLDEYYFHKVEHYPLDIWDIPRKYRRGEKKNGTALPEAVVRKCIDFSSKPGDIVLDPFMGNGTTAVVAKANYRHFVGFEINQNLEPVISKNLLATYLGEKYTSYASRLPSPEELRKKYPRAYKIYMRGKGNATKGRGKKDS